MSLDPTKRAARNARYRAAHAKKKLQQTNQFIGVDGEGGGTDVAGRQNFLLLRAGELELFATNRPLRTRECLDFILGTPKNAILCGYYFTYDATQILRDLPPDRLANLFEEKPKEKGISRYTFWHEYGIEFKPRQYFRVCLIDQNTLKSIPGTSRTVNEVGGFFQKSFVEAIRDWNVGDPATVAMIAENKERRSEFVEITQRERDYCAAECRMLAELMTKLREVCKTAGIEPKAWRGAGWLAARLHEMHGTPRRLQRLPRPAVLEAIANAAYYGGRFEVTQIGRIPGPVYEYDINSAYPAAMLALPCPEHTLWRKFKEMPPEGSVYVAKIAFQHSKTSVLCGFPVRQKGKLFWPRMAEGIYWSTEIHSALLADSELSLVWNGGYYAQRRCDCRPFTWVEELYHYRKSLGKSTAGYPIKLGINGLYGKLAQRQGAAPFRDHISAGFITAYCRAKLIAAYVSDPHSVAMLATDGIFSRKPLNVELGDGLGQWEAKTRETGLFIVQPGIYWSPGSNTLPKTRGIPRSKIIERRADFEQIWDNWVAGIGPDDPPAITVPVTSFIGHRLALAWNKPEMAGRWMVIGKHGGRRISFDWTNKRQLAGEARQGLVYTLPYDGFPGLRSEAFDPAALEDLERQNLELEAAPDYEPLGNSGE